MKYDLLIIGGGAAGLSCALVIGSALKKPFAEGKKVGIIMHQRNSHLQSALLNNAFGYAAGTRGMVLLKDSVEQLEQQYPEVEILQKEKVKRVAEADSDYIVETNKAEYAAANVVVAVGYTSPMRIGGLEQHVIPHQKAKTEKNRLQLRNEDHLVQEGLYVAGTLAGWRSQVTIASGSGAAVATDILTKWNNNEHTKVHDKLG